MSKLVVRTDGGIPTYYTLGDSKITIGRSSSCTIVLPLASVSREHACIEFSEGQYVLRDEGSANGVVVNGEKVEKHSLAHGDKIAIGTAAIEVILEQEASEVAKPVDEKVTEHDLRPELSRKVKGKKVKATHKKRKKEKTSKGRKKATSRGVRRTATKRSKPRSKRTAKKQYEDFINKASIAVIGVSGAAVLLVLISAVCSNPPPSRSQRSEASPSSPSASSSSSSCVGRRPPVKLTGNFKADAAEADKLYRESLASYRELLRRGVDKYDLNQCSRILEGFEQSYEIYYRLRQIHTGPGYKWLERKMTEVNTKIRAMRDERFKREQQIKRGK